MSHGVSFSPHALLIFCSLFSHLVSSSLTSVCNFTLNIKSSACNRKHTFPYSVRMGCLISEFKVRLIPTRKRNVFIHFV